MPSNATMLTHGINMVIQFPFFVSSRPPHQAEFYDISRVVHEEPVIFFFFFFLSPGESRFFFFFSFFPFFFGGGGEGHGESLNL